MRVDAMSPCWPGWGPDSENPTQVPKRRGGTPAYQAAGLKNLNLVPRSEQVSEAWLGGGEKSGVAKILKETSAFLKEQKKISQVQGSYAKYVTPTALK